MQKNIFGKRVSLQKVNKQSGQVIMMTVMIFLVLSLVVVIGIASPIASQIKNSNLILSTRKSVNSADILQDDALYRLNSGRTLPATMVLSVNGSTSTAQVTDVGGSKQIIAIGESGTTQRASRAKFTQGTGVSINFGLQVGNGGFQMSGGPTVYGNVYSNGNITASGGSTITGNATVASYLSDTPIMQNGTTSTPTTTIDVGKSNNVQLFAQKFRLATTTQISSFNVYVKKTGAPANATLKIYNNSGGSVGTTQIGGTGSMSASLVTTTYDWVEIYPATPVSISANTDYWMTIEYQGSNSNYYTFATNNGEYSDGQLKLKNKSGTTWGSYYDATSGQDVYFSMSVGTTGTISGMTINGSANAGSVNSSTVSGALYCQLGTGNNKSCDPSQPLPTAIGMPISAANIQAWKDEASSGTVRNSTWNLGNNTATSTPGPMKINGDLIVGGGAVLTLNGPLYVTGLFKVEGGGRVQLATGYGTGDEFIVANTASLQGGGVVTGNGQSGSYVLLVADKTDTGSAITIVAEGGASSVVLMAPFGTIKFSGGFAAKSAVANKIIMEGGATVTYESGLADISFDSGPSGAWNVDTWKEIEQ